MQRTSILLITLILSLVGFALGDNLTFKKYSCEECKANSGMLCLNPTSHLKSTCCDPSEAVTDENDPCFKGPKNLYCSDQSTPSDAFWDFSCAASSEKCPESTRMVKINLDKVGTEQKRKIKWFDYIPLTDDAWHCKYFVSTAAMNDDTITDFSTVGYTRLATLTQNYNHTVWLMVQPKGKFAEDTSAKWYNVSYGEVFYVPAEYQILISTNPDRVISDNGTSEWSEFLMQAEWVQEPNPDLTKLSYVFTITRPASAGGELTDDYAAKKGLEKQDEVVPVFNLNDFLEQDLFEFRGRTFTVKDVAKASLGLIIVIVIGVIICLAVSWWKRRAIAKAAKDTGAAVVRLSQRVRQSFRGSQAPPNQVDDKDVEMKEKDRADAEQIHIPGQQEQEP